MKVLFIMQSSTSKWNMNIFRSVGGTEPVSGLTRTLLLSGG